MTDWPDNVVGGLTPTEKDGITRRGYVHLAVSYVPVRLWCGTKTPSRWKKSTLEDFDERDYRTRCIRCEMKLDAYRREGKYKQDKPSVNPIETGRIPLSQMKLELK